MAVWDAVAKIAGVPLYRHLADTEGDGTVDDSVFVYAAGGYYYPGKDNTALQEEMRRYRGMGYEVVKMKIGGAPLEDDIARIEAVLEVAGGEVRPFNALQQRLNRKTVTAAKIGRASCRERVCQYV